MNNSQDNGCFLHPDCLTCPEPICIFDFPGGPKAYLKHKKMRALLDSGMDIDQAARELSINKRTAQRRFTKSVGRSNVLSSKS